VPDRPDARTLRCDLHLHTRWSTDSGNYALRRARLGESFTEPERAFHVARARGMDLVTITDHNTLEGALRVAHHPETFLGVEVTTRFPEDDTPLHVLVWGLTEDDHRDLQPWRASVYELVRFLRERSLTHALAHPLYRMGPPLTVSHVERMMLLFGVWEGRNGARPEEANALACRLAAVRSPAYLAKLADRHGLEPPHPGQIGLVGGSDDHGALDIATTWSEALAHDAATFLAEIAAGHGTPFGGHGSTRKLAHAVASLLYGAYRAGGRRAPEPWDALLAGIFDDDAPEADARHAEIADVASHAARALGERARAGGFGLDALPGAGTRLATLVAAGALHLPYLTTAHHHAGSRAGLREIEEGFFGVSSHGQLPRTLVFTDTYDETNGVAAAMRRLHEHAVASGDPVLVVAACKDPADEPGLLALEPEWSLPLPAYERIELRFPPLLDLLERVERERPELIHVATPGPMGLCGLAAARILGLPVVGSYHTELGPYALHLTRDALVADATGTFVDWFYRQCDVVLAPTKVVASALVERGYGGRVRVWGRSVDARRFRPERRDLARRHELLDGGELLLLSVGRVSPEKRLDVLLAAVALLRADRPEVRLVVAGDGPARAELEAGAPDGARFLGELHGDELADLYACADVFCFPSTTDTYGQVLLEAAASGLPTVAARAGGAAELVHEGRTGLLVPPGDAAALAAALRTLVDGRAQRRTLGRIARHMALERTTARALAELQAGWAAALAGNPAAMPEPAGLPV
jgi:glycosyltransferase involved in cell wall biosynthesis/predicted metal-dependent phosphoesterase TrpH